MFAILGLNTQLATSLLRVRPCGLWMVICKGGSHEAGSASPAGLGWKSKSCGLWVNADRHHLAINLPPFCSAPPPSCHHTVYHPQVYYYLLTKKKIIFYFRNLGDLSLFFFFENFFFFFLIIFSSLDSPLELSSWHPPWGSSCDGKQHLSE